MRIEQVKKIRDPLARLRYWILERESIRLKKEAGEPHPWTDDEILQRYRFCNVRRMDDKVSRWLLESWYKPYFNHPNMLAACALARFINLPSTLELITESVFKRYSPSAIKRILRDRMGCGSKVFNNAYVITAAASTGVKSDIVVNEFVSSIRNKVKETPINVDSFKETCTLLASCYGLGMFMAGQITADLRHAVGGKWSDRCTWAPMGPGSQRGMNRANSRQIKSPLKQEQFLNELMDLIKNLDLPEAIASRLEAIDYQNICCEGDKYERALWGEGSPKQLYRFPNA